MTRNSRSPSDNKPIRWWPAIVILVAVLGMLAWIWLNETGNTQIKVVSTFPTLFFGAVFLFIWLVLFSRLPGKTRLAAFLSLVLVVGLGSVALEIKGVDGNLVPILGFRWSPERTFGDSTASVAEDKAPGPDDYPQFYGPDRSATLPGPELARDWKARPPREIWRREVGEGWSSFAVVGDAAVTHEQRADTQAVVRYDVKSGEQVWVHVDAEAFNRTVGGRGPRATPTIADGKVYSLSATGALSCLELSTGKPVWTTNVLEDHKAAQPEWGTPSSPLVVGDLVIVQLGKGGTGLAAYDRHSGEAEWLAGDDLGTYSSPLAVRLFGRDVVLIVNRDSVLGHDPTTGEVVLTADWPNPSGGERITMPVLIGEDRMLVSAGYGVGSTLFQLVPKDDHWTGEPLWESLRLKSKFAPMVLHEGVVYGLDDGILVALDPETGERHWKRGRYGHGQIILVDDLLLIQAENGDVVLVEADPEEHRELARISALDSKTWNPPALSGNLLLVRNNKEAVCFELPVNE